MQYLFLLYLTLISLQLQAQADELSPKERRENAFRAINDLKEDGCIVVRLKTKHRKIKILEQNVRGLEGKPKRQRRYQEMLDGTIQRRDAINFAMIRGFSDSFSICKIYFMHDTASRKLLQGERAGIFLNDKQEADPSTSISEKHVFIVDFKPRSGEFPFDVLKMQRLGDDLDDPFPYFVQVRSSFINSINTPRIERAARQWDDKLMRFYLRKLDKIEELEED